MVGRNITVDIIFTKESLIENSFIKQEISFKITYLILQKVL
jgi:hypothetical protein